MLRKLKDLEGFAISATDGIIGHLKEFYFDDESWVVRYFVVETGTWLDNRRVLISPMAIGRPDWAERLLPSTLTRDQVRNGPDIDADKPVSRQHEMGYLGYYGYPNYWGGGGLWGAGIYPDMLQGGLGTMGAGAGGQEPRAGGRHTRTFRNKARIESSQERRQNDLHLRSANTVMHYYVHATDGDIGHVEDMFIEEQTWAIRYIIVNTSNWWLGHKVLIAPEWVDDFHWTESKLLLALTRQSVKEAPAYHSKTPFDREQEKTLHTHYGQLGYWPDESPAPRTVGWV